MSDETHSRLIKGATADWEVVVGLEVHAQVTSRAKLFSGASTAFGGEPNTHVSLVDAAMPGMLPVINRECVAQAVRTGLGLKAKINLRSSFDRKNYFYPDLPQGYQISQYKSPIVGEGEVVVDKDETPFALDIAKIPTLKPAFKKDGTVTAASSSGISDGAAALVLARESFAASRDRKPLARILGYASFAREPEWFTLAPVGAMQKLLSQLNWQARDVDLYEINEAFAAVTMAAMKDLGLDHQKVNVNGGACALGHPIGATGARIMTTLLHALRARGKKRGIASLCIGGGEATAIAIEVM